MHKQPGKGGGTYMNIGPVSQNAQLAFDKDFGLMGMLNKFYELPQCWNGF